MFTNSIGYRVRILNFTKAPNRKPSMIDPNDTHNPPQPPRERLPFEDHDERADYEDYDIPKLRWWPATKHYRLLSWIFTVYGILCCLTGVGLMVLVGTMIPQLKRRSYLKSDAIGISIASVIVFLFAIAFLVLSRRMRRQTSLWPLRIMSLMACVVGASYFFCSYTVFTWLGIYGLVVVSQISVRTQLGKPLPEYLRQITDGTPTQEDVINLDTQNQLSELKNELIAKTNRSYLSWIVPIVIGLLLSFGSAGIVAHNLIHNPNQHLEVVALLSLFLLVVILTYLPGFVAFLCMRSRRFAIVVWLAIAFNLFLGLIPLFGILHYAIGCWLFAVMLMPEVRYTYGKVR